MTRVKQGRYGDAFEQCALASHVRTDDRRGQVLLQRLPGGFGGTMDGGGRHRFSGGGRSAVFVCGMDWTYTHFYGCRVAGAVFDLSDPAQRISDLQNLMIFRIGFVA